MFWLMLLADYVLVIRWSWDVSNITKDLPGNLRTVTCIDRYVFLSSVNPSSAFGFFSEYLQSHYIDQGLNCIPRFGDVCFGISVILIFIIGVQDMNAMKKLIVHHVLSVCAHIVMADLWLCVCHYILINGFANVSYLMSVFDRCQTFTVLCIDQHETGLSVT